MNDMVSLILAYLLLRELIENVLHAFFVLLT